jgi:single-stranded DNA-binding protein
MKYNSKEDYMVTNKNYIELSGRLTKDIVLKVSKGEQEYGIISIAINKYYNDSGGYLKNNPVFFDIFIWHPTVLELYGDALKKGVRVIVRAELAQYEGRVMVNVTSHDGVSVLQEIKPKNKTNKSEIEQEYGDMSVSEAEIHDLVH